MNDYIEMVRVNSSFIRAIGYGGGTLVVEFLSGSSCEYHNVPVSVFEAFLCSSSKGDFFNSKIRGRYR